MPVPDSVTAKSSAPATSAYDTRAREFADAYELLGFEQVHEHILDLLPKTPGRIVDEYDQKG